MGIYVQTARAGGTNLEAKCILLVCLSMPHHSGRQVLKLTDLILYESH